jgi:glycosyltransferase involved in cell wall biosynthesis
MLSHLSYKQSASASIARRPRLAIIVSHPIQYYVPIYQRLVQQGDIEIKVFFTWHDGSAPTQDRGFGQPISWDIPLREGYAFETVRNIAADPGMHHFLGLRNPDLVDRVMEWKPSIVHITGWAWWSHLRALKALHDLGVPTLFRGDSHLLDEKMRGPRWWMKKACLSHIFRWPTAFLVPGQASEQYYRAFGVAPSRLIHSPHAIDCARFAEPHETYEKEAHGWRRSLGISDEQLVFLFAGKFEPKKRPIDFMTIVQRLEQDNAVAVMVGSGEQQAEVDAIARAYPARFRVLPFQNQSRMPVVYRLGDRFVLPSLYGETWGLAVNEAMACGRPVLVSDKVGCAPDVVDSSCGYVAASDALPQVLRGLAGQKRKLQQMRSAAATKSWSFDISRTVSTLREAVLELSSV